MLFQDPPDHTRLRALVSRAFTPRVVEGLRPRIQQIVDEIIDRALDARSMEVIGDLAYPLPVTVISEMLGVPAGDHESIKGWSADIARSLDAIGLQVDPDDRRSGPGGAAGHRRVLPPAPARAAPASPQ